MSPFQRSKLRKLGEAAARAAAPVQQRRRSGAAATEYELQKARLGVDLRRLSEIQSLERKIELKTELLPGYRDWVEGVLAADEPVQDEILVHVMIWLIDVGAISSALPLVQHVLKHKLTLPERFSRTPATLIAEESAEAALKLLGKGEDIEPHVLRAMLDDLDSVEHFTSEEDMFDQVRAKLQKAIGLGLIRLAAATPADADGPAGGQRARQARGLKHLQRAYELDQGCGVKTEINRLERELKKTAPAEPPAQ